jgi:tripartite-type tricarboxylate transporter receptor subunit TctC
MFPAGGLADLIARTAANELSKALGQAVVVDNRPGANGQIAAEYVARAAADGHTLFLASDAAISINPLIYTKLRYDPHKDFAPISQFANTVECLLVGSQMPANNVQQFVQLLKANPAKYNYGSFGIGSNAHLGAEMFKAMTGTDMTHVPYKGVAETVPALLSDQIQVLFTSQAQALPHIRSGKIKALAVFSSRRQETLPGVATASEQGVAGMDGGGWFGLMAPAGTPRDIVDRLARECAKVARSEIFKTRVIDALGLEVIGNTPAEFGDWLQKDKEKYGRMVQAAKVRLDAI